MDKPKEDGYVDITVNIGKNRRLVFFYEDMPSRYRISVDAMGVEVSHFAGTIRRVIYPWHTIDLYEEFQNSDAYQLALVAWQDECEHVWGEEVHGIFGHQCHKQCEKCERFMPLHDGREHSADENTSS